jgi:hypothetical protein
MVGRSSKSERHNPYLRIAHNAEIMSQEYEVQ